MTLHVITLFSGHISELCQAERSISRFAALGDSSVIPAVSLVPETGLCFCTQTNLLLTSDTHHRRCPFHVSYSGLLIREV
jgi:hypothetical protein